LSNTIDIAKTMQEKKDSWMEEYQKTTYNTIVDHFPLA
jgi:hypothetical protein